jgi:WD40 repeat protein/DNA-binding SARP family transcriptional activator
MVGPAPTVQSGLEFRLLGPLEVWRGGQQLRLGGERQRGLLALLLLHVNELVTSEQLVDQLFGADAGDDGVRSLRVAVSRLRRLLANGEDSGVLVTRPGGYLARVDPDQLDTARFERLLQEGQRNAAAGDPLAAAVALREALGLWRGPALGDLSLVEFVQPEIRRLEELRLGAVLDRIDADLALGRDTELIAELEALVAANPLQERARGQLMLALYRAGRQADALAAYRQTSDLLRDELGLEPSRALQQLERSMLQQDESLELTGRARPAAPDRLAVCPFKGLAPFERSDADYFCGRERVVSDLVTRLAAATLVGIVGPSGVGKSSILRAGVLPALGGGVLPGSAGWRQVLVRPGEHPRAALDRALDTDGMAQALRELGRGERIVISVDQLEELFTVCTDDREREAFIDELMTAAADQDRRALVLVSLRADFYGRCASFTQFAGQLSRNHVLVGPMGREELTRAIELPAARAGLLVERALVDALVADVVGEPGGLPLMSTALLELWRARDGNRLGYASYRASGGVDGAVARLAEEAYTRLSETDRHVARGLMLRLAAGEGDSLVRRRLPFAELDTIDGAQRVLSTLTDARLLAVSDGEVEVSHEALFREWPRFRGWIEEDRAGRRVHAHLTASATEWRAGGRDRADLYRGARLAAALDWSAQHPGELNTAESEFIQAAHAESQSDQRRQRVQNRRLRGLLTGVGVLLILAVIAGIVALVKQQHAATDARVALARQLGAEAVSEPRIDLAVLLARESVNLHRDPQTEGTLLATLLRSPAAIGTFALPIDARPQGVAVSPDGRTVAIPDNNQHLWLYNARTHALQRTLTDGLTNDSPVYSSDGSLLVYAAHGRPGSAFVAVRNARTLDRLSKLSFDRRWQTYQTTDDAGGSFLVAPNDRTIYYAYWILDAAGNPGAAYIDRWSLPSGRLLSTTALGTGPVLAKRLVAGGRRLVVVNSTSSQVFDTRSMRRLSAVTIVPTPGENATEAAISPNGRAAAIGSSTGSVSFVDLATGSTRPGVGGHTAYVVRVAYSPDGRVVATTGDDNQVIIWDPQHATPIEVLGGHAGGVHGAAFSSDGQTLYTSSLDGVVLAWDLGGERRFGRPFTTGTGLTSSPPGTPPTPPLAISPGGATFAVRIGQATVGLFSTQTLRKQRSFVIPHRGGVIDALAWSPDRRELAVAAQSGVVQLWSVSGTPRLLRSLKGLRPPRGQPEAVQAIAFAPGGALLAASDGAGVADRPWDGHLAIWRAATGTLVAAPTDLGQPGDSIAFSPNGRELAVGLDRGPALILDATRGRVRWTLHPLGSADHEPIISLAFAPNGTLATGSWTGIVQLWNPANGDAIDHAVLVAAGPVASISFDPGGGRFATTGGGDGSAKLWFTDTLQQEGSTFQGEAGAAWGNTAFSRNGRKLIVIYDDGQGFAWPVSPASWDQHACAIAGRNLTREEWARFVTGQNYSPVCR